MQKYGFAKSDYPTDGLVLVDAAISNSVRCVPPENKPTPEEIRTCRTFLAGEFAARPHVRAVLALGRIAHDSVVRALGQRLAACPFTHGASHACAGIRLYDSYHCSRYNTNTGVLTTEMFEAVFAKIKQDLDGM